MIVILSIIALVFGWLLSGWIGGKILKKIISDSKWTHNDESLARKFMLAGPLFMLAVLPFFSLIKLHPDEKFKSWF